MRTVWREVQGFPNYEVNDQGEFVNSRTDHPVRPSMNQMGHAKVTLVQNRIPTTRAVAPLVAEAFLPEPPEYFNTIIHLDGDYMNCCAENLMWRPRWFAIKYHRQFQFEAFHNDQAPRYDVATGTEYANMKELCMANGLYYFDVIKSCVEETFVPLTYQEFRNVK